MELRGIHMYEALKCEVSNRVMTITLNRPEKLNAFNPQMSKELIHALDRADKDDEVRVVVVTGEGRAFCSGADLGKGPSSIEEDFFSKEEGSDESNGGFVFKIYNLKKPIIAAINGPAVGVGITMALPMDIRICSTNAKIGFVFTKRGILPEAGCGWFLPKLVGISKALEWVYTAEMISPQEALENGLVNKVVPPEELLPTAMELATKIAENTSATAIALSRQLFWKMLGENHPASSYIVETKGNLWASRQKDAKEGISSFLEKRPANFTMKPSTDLPDFYPWWEEPNLKLD